jgi:hypothetical protein
MAPRCPPTFTIATTGALAQNVGSWAKFADHRIREDFQTRPPGVPLHEVQVAARHSDPRTTTVYDRRRHPDRGEGLNLSLALCLVYQACQGASRRHFGDASKQPPGRGYGQESSPLHVSRRRAIAKGCRA